MTALDILTKLTKHKFVRLTNRGNSAILNAIRIAKETYDKEYILIPDQGGWLSYQKYPLKEGFKIKELKTDYGVVDLSELDTHLDNCAAIILSQPAGYFASLDIKDIYKRCKNKCLVILDVTGSLGDEELCNGKFADILLGSFGEWKPVNLGYGGFISFNDKNLFELSNKIPLNDFDNTKESDLILKLEQLPERYNLFYKTAETIKSELIGFDILHKGRKGINVVVKFNNEEEKQKIITYCVKRGLEYTLCPRYIRVNENAVSIEVKRLWTHLL